MMDGVDAPAAPATGLPERPAYLSAGATAYLGRHRHPAGPLPGRFPDSRPPEHQPGRRSAEHQPGPRPAEHQPGPWPPADRT
jgi:hypothetical protein